MVSLSAVCIRSRSYQARNGQQCEVWLLCFNSGRNACRMSRGILRALSLERALGSRLGLKAVLSAGRW